MPNSILLHLNGVQAGEPIVELGVKFARRCQARVRGLALLDTRRLLQLVTTCESAVYAGSELLGLKRLQQQQEVIRNRLHQACLNAGLSCDMRILEGDPLQLLSSESQFHDLVVTFFPSNGAQPNRQSPCQSTQGLTPREMHDLLCQGVQPLLIVRQPEQQLQRVLLVYDGTVPSGKAVRQILSQRLLPDAEYRLMAIGANAAKTREFFSEMVAYCQFADLDIETGYLCGALRRTLPAYIEKWEADLVVTGVLRDHWPRFRLQRAHLEHLLLKTNCAIYAMS